MFYIQTIAVSLGAGLLTWFLTRRLHRGAVLSSAIVTLTAGLVLPELFAQGGALVPMAACASYVSMSADTRLGKLWQTVLALVMAAVLYVASSSIFAGVGGKGGTIAAICVMAVWGSTQIIKGLSKRAADFFASLF